MIDLWAWAEAEKKRVDAFVKWWEEGQEVFVDDFPDDLPDGEWDKEYRYWERTRMTPALMTGSEAMTDKPIRVQRSRAKGWTLPPNTVCVTRPGPFGNPFPVVACKSHSAGQSKKTWTVGRWHGAEIWFLGTKEEAIELSVKTFRTWVEHDRQETFRETVRLVLRGRNLACWCRLDHPCHADVLLEIANAP